MGEVIGSQRFNLEWTPQGRGSLLLLDVTLVAFLEALGSQFLGLYVLVFD
jgi:hypothetical protein